MATKQQIADARRVAEIVNRCQGEDHYGERYDYGRGKWRDTSGPCILEAGHAKGCYSGRPTKRELADAAFDDREWKRLLRDKPDANTPVYPPRKGESKWRTERRAWLRKQYLIQEGKAPEADDPAPF